jgi:hypothetical protein
LVTAALNREPTLTMDQQQRQAEDYQRAEEEAYYKALDAAAADEAEDERRAIMVENDITAAGMDRVYDEDISAEAPWFEGLVTQESLLRSWGFSESDINDELLKEQRFADANEQARQQQAGEQAGEQLGNERRRAAPRHTQEARGDGPGRPGAPDATGAAAQGPAGDGDQAQAQTLAQHNAAVDYVDLAAASMTDAQVMAVAQILGIDGRRSVPMQRTLIVTRDSLAARAAIEQVLAQAPSTPDAADFELNAQTSEELRARAAGDAAADKKDADEQRRLDAKARADAGVGDFVLTGSDRPADVGAANGQQDIFADPPAAPQIDLSDTQAFANDYAAFVGRDMARSMQLDDGTQAVLRMDAAQALREMDARASALDSLKLCIGGRA